MKPSQVLKIIEETISAHETDPIEPSLSISIDGGPTITEESDLIKTNQTLEDKEDSQIIQARKNEF